MPQAWAEFPVGVTFALLWAGSVIRGQGTYWLARVATSRALARTHAEGGRWARVRAWLEGDAVARGRRSVERFGLVAVTLCYLTVGVQTMVIAGAGVLRLRWPRFAAAQAAGSVLWATLYTTIGFAFWATAWAAATRSPWLPVALVALAAAGALVWRLRGLRSAATERTAARCP